MKKGGTCVIFSAPQPASGFDAGLRPYSPRDGTQMLLGWEGQMSSLAAAVAEREVCCLVTPAPELFFTAVSFDLLARQAGLEPEAVRGALHWRFGPAREARLLRGIGNFMVNAETAEAELLAPGHHPFRQHDGVPAAMLAGLDLLPQARALFGPRRAGLPRWPVPAGFAAADLPAAATGPVTLTDCDGIDVTGIDITGLDITGIDEFDLPGWFAAAGARGGALLRRLLREHHAGVGRPLYVLPWNLARPVATMPALAAEFQLAASGAAVPPVMVMLPFNLTAPPGERLIRELERLKSVNAGADAGSPELLVARVTRPGAARMLGRLGAVGLLDRNDPEAAWTETRLRACGIASRFLQPDGDTSGAVEEINDALGQRFQRVVRPDPGHLARLADELSDSPPVVGPAAPLAPGETALWLNKFAPHWRAGSPAAGTLA